MFIAQRLFSCAIAIAGAASMLLGPGSASAQGVLNIYSARHYQTDEALYANFTQQTGIRINRLDGKEDELLERLKSEGASSPADLLITVDAARLDIADKAGLFQPIQSPIIDARIPAAMRTSTWAAFSTRARVVVYNKANFNPAWLQTYEDLAAPRLKSQVCVRSGAHPYNLSLGSALIAHQGEAQTEAWARGLVSNFARAPKGGDTDQLRAVAAGECGVTISNSYYLARLMRSTKPEDQQVMRALGVIWPNQQTWGAHVNVSGAGIIKTAPNRAAAVKFMEYLASDSAQAYFADGNNEWPVVKSAKNNNPALDALGSFKPDALPIGQLAANTALAQRVFDRAGWR
jgi:iron(III) transport system substrate-binding protein